MDLPHTISVLFWFEILPDNEENVLETNELWNNIGETVNTGKLWKSLASKISCRNNTNIVWGRPTSGLDIRLEVENTRMYDVMYDVV